MGDIDFSEPWNKDSQVPISEWLQDKEGAEDAARLRAMGNIVVPLQARKAVSNLAQIRALLES